MKSIYKQPKIRLILIIIFAAVGVWPVQAQSTAFTYQGKLTDSSLPANGTYQMQFSLFDAAADGTQVGSTITKSSVTVMNGLFTVQLDFSVANAFDGNARWLEISV